MSTKARVFCITQPTASSQQGGYGVMGAGYQAFDHGYRVMSGINTQTSEHKMYQGAVYEPFNDTPPSENGNGSQISGRKNAWGGGGMGDNENDDPGHRDPNSPIGEPFVLLLFAAVAAVIRLRKKQTA